MSILEGKQVEFHKNQAEIQKNLTEVQKNQAEFREKQFVFQVKLDSVHSQVSEILRILCNEWNWVCYASHSWLILKV